MRFLLIEDNEKLSKAVADRLSLDGHVLDQAATLQEGWEYLATTAYDMILLDIMLPDGDGRDFLDRWRKERQTTPIIVLTARSAVSDRVSILDLGADDYMVKPIDFSELEARCRAVIRRRQGESRNLITLGDVSFDSLAGTLATNQGTIQLRTRELRLFEIFAKAPGRIFSKAQLVDHLFSYEEDISENAIEVYVGRLRRHLRDSSAEIITVRGSGYKLEAA